MHQVLSACSFIHEEGIIHGDLKPRSFLISELNLKDIGAIEIKLAHAGYSSLLKSVPSTSMFLQES